MDENFEELKREVIKEVRKTKNPDDLLHLMAEVFLTGFVTSYDLEEHAEEIADKLNEITIKYKNIAILRN